MIRLTVHDKNIQKEEIESGSKRYAGENTWCS